MNADPTLRQCHAQATESLKEFNNGFKLIAMDEDNRRLIFEKGCITFFIGCPSTPQENDWSVWSDNEAVHPCLTDVIDWISSGQRSIADIIEKTCRASEQLFIQNDTEMDDEEEDDQSDNDEDYNNGIEDAYYENEDNDAMNDVAPPPTEEENTEGNFYAQISKGQGASSLAIQRLCRDMKTLGRGVKTDAEGKEKDEDNYGFVAEPRGDDLFTWDVKLTQFDKKTKLGKDIEDYAVKYKREPVVSMELQFPPDYPMSPPFARILRPRFEFLTGHVTIGGSICMEMLTRSGWRPTNDIESILVQIRSEIMSDPNARLDRNPDREYDITEAKTAFQRTVAKYGWGS